jgi:hypothetical protein
MSQLGQSRRSDRAPFTSGLPRLADQSPSAYLKGAMKDSATVLNLELTGSHFAGDEFRVVQVQGTPNREDLP